MTTAEYAELTHLSNKKMQNYANHRPFWRLRDAWYKARINRIIDNLSKR